METSKNYDLDEKLGEQYFGGSKQEEDLWIKQIVDPVTKLMDEFPHPKTDLTTRGAHAKGFGLVKAKFQVKKDLPEWVYKGVFISGAEYDALLRFSNGSPAINPDKKGDTRGIAIKLLDIPGKKILVEKEDLSTQDFTLCSSPFFFATDIKKYARFLEVFRKYRKRSMALAGGLAAATLLFKEARLLITANRKKTENPFADTYWSQTPQRHGLGEDRVAVKYIMKPVGGGQAPQTKNTDNYLQSFVCDYLKNTSARFDFCIQQFVDHDRTPIEETTVEWDEDVSPPLPIATITIQQGNYENEEDFQSSGEHLSFTPWHTLPEHRPLGVVNRTRRVLYFTGSQHRNAKNQVDNKD